MECKPELGVIRNASRFVRFGLLAVASTLAVGDAMAGAEASSAHPASPIAAAYAGPIPPNESFGLSGVNVGSSGLSLQSLPQFKAIASPNSRYPNANLRLLVHDGDIPGAEQQINQSLAYSRAYQGYNPASMHTAPEIVSTTVDNKDVQLAAHGRDLCDPKLAKTNTPNPHYNLNKCEKTALKLEDRSLRRLMGKYSMIHYWTAQNEPENSGQPSSPTEGGPAFAVKQWLVANKIAQELHRQQQIAPGEFWVFPSHYEKSYYELLAAALKKQQIAVPGVEALHLYRVINCNDYSLLSGDLNDLKRFGLYAPLQTGDGILGTESGVWLSSNLRCPNALAMANGRHKNTATLTKQELSRMAEAQLVAAKAALGIGSVDPSIHVLQDMYNVQSTSVMGWHGGAWDSAWIAPNGKFGSVSMLPDGTGIPGQPRIAYYVMTGQPVPDWMLHPKTLQQMQADELALIPPANWTGSKPGKLAYGKVIVH